MMPRHLFRGGALILALVAAGACKDDQRYAALALESEWRLTMYRGHAMIADGPLVIDRRIPRYPDPAAVEYTEPGRVGRRYMDVRALIDSARLPASGSVYAAPPDGDAWEETVISFPASDSIYIAFAPQVIGIEIRLAGGREHGGFRGTWYVSGHGISPDSGSFEMHPTTSTPASDSAVVRARRGVREFRRN